jgi:poly(beta-D-mannuronate) lyase
MFSWAARAGLFLKRAHRPITSALLFVIACGDGTGGGAESSTSAPDDDGGSSAGPESTDGGSGGTDGAATSSGAETVDDADATDDAASSSSDGDSVGPTAEVPGEVLDLTDWKLTLPIGSRREPDAPLEIFQPELATYAIDPYFVLDAAKTGVVFHAHAGGVTTSNSGYPRSELREMANGGADEADWSTTVGVHTMTITQAITHLPEVKPHVVAGQIHDSEDDVVMIRLEDTHLFVEGGGDELGDLATDYVLGTPFTVRLTAADGIIDVYYEDMAEPVVSIERDATGCYFKAGAYTQSNLEQGDDASAYGEVVITDLVVTHE